MKKYFLIYVVFTVFSTTVFANMDLKTLKQQARCLIATHHFTKVYGRQIFLDGIYSIYPHTAGTPDGSDGGILYSENKIYFLDLKPAIIALAAQPNVNPDWIQGWIILKNPEDVIFTQYSGKFYKDDSPLTVTGAPAFFPKNAQEVTLKEVFAEDSELLEAIKNPFEDALKLAREKVVTKLETIPSKKRKSILKTMDQCSGIINFGS